MDFDERSQEALKYFEAKRQENSDERDRIQKKTFTKWVNRNLTKRGRRVEDLFVDLRNGFNLIALLEELTQEVLPKENGETRFHRTQNVQCCLDFLQRRHIKLVNIRPKDIVDGNGKLTLGLIWTIILSFQISVITQRQAEEEQKRERRRSSQQSPKIESNGEPGAEALNEYGYAEGSSSTKGQALVRMDKGEGPGMFF
ncbi:unnamed protein product [Bursaphelenchus okinawaensis]|uniref:Calponin-homology (CH) domain-containing protein n=1 Tax=Bursaphelenchus okinawaensis TaxID=465554 RepID=A0A811JQ12_9BILA|nr:unnamed protein product [Bursaphelenchus okinawaensis]CAG9077356.1 unnamed protein product [Bursaphelenchus okinawaensis]